MSTQQTHLSGVKQVGIVLGALVGGLAGYFAVAQIPWHGSVEHQIQQIASELNQRMPIQVDEYTQCIRVEPGPGKSYAYIYRVNCELTEAGKRDVTEAVTREVLSRPEMKGIFDAGVTVWYKYYDAKGTLLLEFPVRK